MKYGTIRSLFCLALVVVTIAGCSSGHKGALGSGGGPEVVEGGAVFRYHNSRAKRVYLVGDFNYWSPRGDPMKDPEGDGNWSLFYPLAPGSYSYKFVVDGRWIPDPNNPLDEPDGFGGLNSVVRIPAPGTDS